MAKWYVLSISSRQLLALADISCSANGIAYSDTDAGRFAAFSGRLAEFIGVVWQARWSLHYKDSEALQAHVALKFSRWNGRHLEKNVWGKAWF
jgi:hypothetical protein